MEPVLATVWDPVPFSWPLLGILLVGTLVLTLGFVIWTALQREDPEGLSERSTQLVDKAVRSDQERAALVRRRLDADAGRADSSEPELR